MPYALKYSNILTFDGQFLSLEPHPTAAEFVKAIKNKNPKKQEPRRYRTQVSDLLETAFEELETIWPEDVPALWFCHLGLERETVYGVYEPDHAQAELPASMLEAASQSIAKAAEVKGYFCHVRHASSEEMSGYWLLIKRTPT